MPELNHLHEQILQVPFTDSNSDYSSWPYAYLMHLLLLKDQVDLESFDLSATLDDLAQMNDFFHPKQV